MQDLDASYPALATTDRNEPTSLVNLLPSVMGNNLKAVPASIWEMTEEQWKKSGDCGAIESQLRHSFWAEYHRAIRTESKMNLTNIWASVCSGDYFRKEIINNSFKLAYICTPPMDSQLRLEELVTLGLEQYREILSLPNINAKGNVDARLVSAKQKIVEDVLNRRRGQVIQRVEVQSKNLNVNVDATAPVSKASTIEELQREIEAIESSPPSSAPLSLPEHASGLSYVQTDRYSDAVEAELIEVSNEA